MPNSRWKKPKDRKEISARDFEVIKRHLNFWTMVLENHYAKIAELARLGGPDCKFHADLEYLKHARSYLKQICYSHSRKVAYEPVPETWEPTE